MQLYSRALSPYSAFVRIVLNLKELPFKTITPPYPLPDDFAQINPLKRLPVLITGSGETLFEATVIGEYLEDHFPEKTLLPGLPRERARTRLLARIAEAQVLTPIMELFVELSQPKPDNARVDKLFGDLDNGLNALEQRLTGAQFAFGKYPTLADAWLLPIRFVIEPLKKLSGRADLLGNYPKFDQYADQANQHPAFLLVWNEMQDGLKARYPDLAAA